MTDLEISKALALAIGWGEENMKELPAKMLLIYPFGKGYCSQLFDYRDWNVIGPIAAKYDCFPYKNSSGVWVSSLTCGGHYEPAHFYSGDTPQEAIAMCVIGAMK